MADKNFQLDIVTPSSTVYSGEVKSFTAPGVVGNFQVLFNHAPLLSAVRNINMQELSMGMSHDYSVAVEEGATYVRVGTAIFGARGE